MFASPLVVFFNKSKNAKAQSLIKINFQKEFASIQESLKLTKTVVNYYRICATLDNLTTVLLRNPNVLHFSGHGVKNSVKDIGTVASLKQGQGDFLVFEDKKACADLLSESMLKDILVKCKNEIKLVFVSSCHSEFIGDIFFNAGIDHVISIRESEKISDSASIIFAKALYQALYTHNGYTICQAFEAAKGIVALQSEGQEIRAGEHHKYILKHRHQRSRCTVFDEDLQLGNATDITPDPLFKNLPGRLDSFIGRASDCQKIIESLGNARIVTITGVSGIGKSAIAKEVSHYLFTRCLMKDGVLYLSLVDCLTIEAFFKKFILHLKEAVREASDQDLVHKIEAANSFDQAIKCMKNREVLLVLDKCDNILKKDHMNFISVIEDILGKATESKMIITSKNHIAHVKDITMKNFTISEMNKNESYELLLAKSERKLDSDEITEMIDECSTTASNINNDASLLDHPLFQLINGHPLALIMVQSLRKEMRLKQIYELIVLIKHEIDSQKKSVNENLAIRLSMEANLLFLRNIDYNSYNSLVYFSLMSSGLSDEACSAILGNHWEESKNLLLSRSLITKRSDVSDHTQAILYRIDANLKDIVLKRTSQQEIDQCDSDLIFFLCDQLVKYLKDSKICEKSSGPLFVQLEGSIWEIFKRFKKRIVSIKRNPTEEHKQAEEDQESSCTESSYTESSSSSSKSQESCDQVNELNINQLPLHPLLRPSAAGANRRVSTYLQRKSKIISDLNDKSSSSDLSDNSHSESDDQSNATPLKFQNSDFSISSHSEHCSEDIEEKEKEAVGVVKQLVSAHKLSFSQNDFSSNFDIFQNMGLVTQRVKYLELHDIQLELKDRSEIQDEESTQKAIIDHFQRGRAVRDKKDFNSVIQQFLLENNFKKQDDLSEQEMPLIQSPKKFSKSKTIRMGYNFNQDKRLSFELSNTRRPTITSNKVSNIFKCNSCYNPKCITGSVCNKITDITESGKLLVIFCCIQILQGNILDATNVIEKYGLKYKTDKFCIANMYKLFGLTYLMEESRDDAISCFNKAIRVFREVKSYHGQASAYYLKSLAVKIKDYEDEYNNVNSEVESRKMAEKAMYMYKLLHHKEGFLKCAAICGSKENPPNKIMKFEKLQDKNYFSFIERESKYDYISLGIEPIFTSRYELNLNPNLLVKTKRRMATFSLSKVKRVSLNLPNTLKHIVPKQAKLKEEQPKATKERNLSGRKRGSAGYMALTRSFENYMDAKAKKEPQMKKNDPKFSKFSALEVKQKRLKSSFQEDNPAALMKPSAKSKVFTIRTSLRSKISKNPSNKICKVNDFIKNTPKKPTNYIPEKLKIAQIKPTMPNTTYLSYYKQKKK